MILFNKRNKNVIYQEENSSNKKNLGKIETNQLAMVPNMKYNSHIIKNMEKEGCSDMTSYYYVLKNEWFEFCYQH